MNNNSLDRFITEIRRAWQPLNTETVATCRQLLEELSKAPSSETWLSELLNSTQGNKELYRDPQHGFMLIAHTEEKGLYRPPHDHGSGWVIYAVQSGEMEMGTYRAITNQKGEMKLVRREQYRMQPGDCKVFLPGDIHDTLCRSNSVLMLRLTSCDLKKEDQDGRMIKYSQS
jgi:predicted metal-dependent enzyme (double-stranded beta helix superfamily)